MAWGWEGNIKTLYDEFFEARAFGTRREIYISVISFWEGLVYNNLRPPLSRLSVRAADAPALSRMASKNIVPRKTAGAFTPQFCCGRHSAASRNKNLRPPLSRLSGAIRKDDL